MSLEKTNDYYHLTPNGWIRGTSKIYDEVVRTVGIPENRIETWERYMVQSCSFSEEVISWEKIWKHESYSDAQLSEIRKKFGKPCFDFKDDT